MALPAQHEDKNAAVNLGAGLQFDFGRVDLRTEVGTRVDLDEVQARPGPDQEDYFTDILASVDARASCDVAHSERKL